MEAEELVRRIASRDGVALAEFYERLQAGSLVILKNWLRNPIDAADALQDVYIVASEGIARGNLRYPRALWGYVNGIIRFMVWRKRSTERHTFSLSGLQQCGALNHTQRLSDFEISERWCAYVAACRSQSPENLAIEAEAISCIAGIIASLNPKMREVVVRSIFNEETPEEICAAMDLTEGQRRMLRCRALKIVRAKLTSLPTFSLRKAS